MPRHDPVPSARPAPHEQSASAWARYRKMMRWMALIAALCAALSLYYISRTEPLRLHMVIATIAGVGLMVLVGTGLMGLVFLSNRTGHDEEAAHGGQDDER